MKNQKNHLSINIIYWSTQIIFWVVALLSLLFVVFNVLLHTNFFGNDLQLHINFPTKINVLETGFLYLNNTNIKIEFVEASSKIHFFNTPLFLAQYIGVAMLAVIGVAFYMTYVFRKFVTNVRLKKIFEITNIRLLQNLAYAIFSFWIFALIYARILYYYLSANLEMENVTISDDFPNYAGFPLLALFIWVLSHIFIHGVKLQEDKDLTI